MEGMLGDPQRATDAGFHHMTHYELNIAMHHFVQHDIGGVNEISQICGIGLPRSIFLPTVSALMVWEALDARDWIHLDDQAIHFTGAGQYYIRMLQSLTASKRLEKIRGSKVGTSNGLKNIPVTVVY